MMNANSSNTTDDSLSGYYDTIAMRVITPVIWALIVVVGVVGNGLVIYIMIKFGDRKPTTLYIINLAIADIAFTVVVIPFNIVHFAIQQWILGILFCKFHSYMIFVTIHATCLTLTAMTIDRYFAIVHPLSSMTRRTQKSVIITAVAIWIAALAVCIPVLVYQTIDGEGCNIGLPNHLSKITFIFYIVSMNYILPLVVIITCYCLILINTLRRRNTSMALNNCQRDAAGLPPLARSLAQQKRIQRLAKMVAFIVTVFAVCWAPIHFFNLWFTISIEYNKTDTFMPSMLKFKIFGLTLSYLNSCINPFVYAFMGDGFRRAMRRCFPSMLRTRMTTSTTETNIEVPMTTMDGGKSTALGTPIQNNHHNHDNHDSPNSTEEMLNNYDANDSTEQTQLTAL